MKSYTFPVEIEMDEDRWFARVPDLESQGAAAWGYTRDEALRNIQEVAQMVIESLLQDGKALPVSVRASNDPMISINV
jgi:predicted RNase H-like HicB family nuclease